MFVSRVSVLRIFFILLKRTSLLLGWCYNLAIVPIHLRRANLSRAEQFRAFRSFFGIIATRCFVRKQIVSEVRDLEASVYG